MGFVSHKAEVLGATQEAIDLAMEAVAQAAEKNAVEETNELIYDTPPSPTYVRTGDLRKSITHKYVPSERTAYIGTNIEYAPYVQFGTRRMHARPFLSNAIEKYIKEYQKLLVSILKRLS